MGCSVYDAYVDRTAHLTARCNDKRDATHPQSADVPVIIPPTSAKLPINSNARAQFYYSALISNDLVFVPSITGDVFVHNIVTGAFVQRLECPGTTAEDGTYNRPAIGGGVAVVKNRVLFYCGGGAVFGGAEVLGHRLVSVGIDLVKGM